MGIQTIMPSQGQQIATMVSIAVTRYRLCNKLIITIPVVLIVLLANWITPSEAAPLHPAIKLAFIPAIKLVDLIFTTAITLFLLRSYGLRQARVAAAFLVTAILCTALLFPLILPALGGNLVAGIACVVLLETAALFAFVNLNWFHHDGEFTAPMTRTLILATFCGNAASLCINAWLVFPLQLRLLRFLQHNS
jgi:hypothetical protein